MYYKHSQSAYALFSRTPISQDTIIKK